MADCEGACFPDQPFIPFIALEDRTDIFICTSPIKMYKYCPYEKCAWVEKHLSPDFLEQVVLTRDKTLVSAGLLIDDWLDITGKRPGQGPSPAPAGSTCSSQPATTGACHCCPPATGGSVGQTDDWKALLDSKRPC